MLVRFLAVVISILSYSAFKLSELFQLGAPAAALASCILIILILSPRLFMRFFTSRDLETERAQLLNSAMSWMSSSLMGVWGTFLMLSIPVDLVELIFPMDNQILTVSVLALSVGLSIFGLYEVLRGPRISEVLIPGASTDLKGLRIVQISDLHIGPTIQSRYVKKVVAKVNSLRPDLVLITGDLVDAPIQSAVPHLAHLKAIEARLGSFYVSGNHEYYWDFVPTMQALRDIGITVLENENRVVEFNGARVMIAGIPDPTDRKNPPNVLRAIAAKSDASSSNDFKILLSHRPDFCDDAERAGVHLQVSGHTHAGQFFPFSLLIPLAHRYYQGLHRHGALNLYVSPGTGYWGPANRFAVAAEISLLIL